MSIITASCAVMSPTLFDNQSASRRALFGRTARWPGQLAGPAQAPTLAERLHDLRRRSSWPRVASTKVVRDRPGDGCGVEAQGRHRVIFLKTSHSASRRTTAMNEPSSIDPTEFLHEQLSQASPDLLRQMLTTFIDTDVG